MSHDDQNKDHLRHNKARDQTVHARDDGSFDVLLFDDEALFGNEGTRKCAKIMSEIVEFMQTKQGR